jgi:hypothetical protein
VAAAARRNKSWNCDSKQKLEDFLLVGHDGFSCYDDHMSIKVVVLTKTSNGSVTDNRECATVFILLLLLL